MERQRRSDLHRQATNIDIEANLTQDISFEQKTSSENNQDQLLPDRQSDEKSKTYLKVEHPAMYDGEDQDVQNIERDYIRSDTTDIVNFDSNAKHQDIEVGTSSDLEHTTTLNCKTRKEVVVHNA